MNVKGTANVTAADLATVEAVVVGHKTVEDMTRWALSQKPPRVFPTSRGATQAGITESKAPGFDVYVQDEYTHDLVVPFDAEGCLYLVYDTT